MIAAEHYEHTASVEGYGVEGDGESMSYVPTVQFQYPDDVAAQLLELAKLSEEIVDSLVASKK